MFDLRRAAFALSLAVVLLAKASFARDPSVILISMDGTRPADIRAEVIPSLVELGKRGAAAPHLEPVRPTNTFPNHVSFATGVRPERHGVVNNSFEDAALGRFSKRTPDIPRWIDVEPIWSLLERRGVATASYYWVGSEGAWPGGRAPRHWRPFSSRTPESEKVEQILAWLDLEDPAERPRLVTSWFHGADAAAHRDGPGSLTSDALLAEEEPALAALVRGLEERGRFADTTLIVVSDHGMATATRIIDLRALLRDEEIPARVHGIGGFAGIVLAHPDRDAERCIVAIRALGLEAWRRSEAPARLGVENPRFGDVVVTAEPGTAIFTTRSGEPPIAGFHGYAPDHPSMWGIFIAAGRGVPAGAELPVVRAIDVAPTVLSLLGVEIPEFMQGRPVLPVVTSPAATETLRPESGR